MSLTRGLERRAIHASKKESTSDRVERHRGKKPLNEAVRFRDRNYERGPPSSDYEKISYGQRECLQIGNISAMQPQKKRALYLEKQPDS